MLLLAQQHANAALTWRPHHAGRGHPRRGKGHHRHWRAPVAHRRRHVHHAWRRRCHHAPRRRRQARRHGTGRWRERSACAGAVRGRREGRSAPERRRVVPWRRRARRRRGAAGRGEVRCAGHGRRSAREIDRNWHDLRGVMHCVDCESERLRSRSLEAAAVGQPHGNGAWRCQSSAFFGTHHDVLSVLRRNQGFDAKRRRR